MSACSGVICKECVELCKPPTPALMICKTSPVRTLPDRYLATVVESSYDHDRSSASMVDFGTGSRPSGSRGLTAINKIGVDSNLQARPHSDELWQLKRECPC